MIGVVAEAMAMNRRNHYHCLEMAMAIVVEMAIGDEDRRDAGMTGAGPAGPLRTLAVRGYT